MNVISKTARHLLRACAVLIITFPMGASALAQPGDFDQIVAFGDSLMDSGNAFIYTGQVATPPFDPIPGAAYAIGGHHFSNGKTWVEVLGQALGLQRSTGPSARNPGVFSNYAVGGSRARLSDRGVSAAFQLDQYLGANGEIASPTALYIFGFGSNDVRDALQAGGENGPPIVGKAVVSVANNLLALCKAGARHVLVPNVANIGTTPFIQGLGIFDPTIPESAKLVSAAFNDSVQSLVDYVITPQCSTTTFYTLDLFDLSTKIFDNSTAFGFVSTQACLEFYTTGGAICSNPNQRFFWDGIHPTKAGHEIIAAEALRVLAAP